VSYAIKGVAPNSCERVNGSAPDYQFAYRFVDDLVAPEDPYVRQSGPSWVLMITPILRHLDLISTGRRYWKSFLIAVLLIPNNS
jgi:hypothetical protein